jgi:hypothetical protein
MMPKYISFPAEKKPRPSAFIYPITSYHNPEQDSLSYHITKHLSSKPQPPSPFTPPHAFPQSEMILRYAKLGVPWLCFFGGGWVVWGSGRKSVRDEEAAGETVLVRVLSSLLRQDFCCMLESITGV